MLLLPMPRHIRKEHACIYCSTQNSTQPTHMCEKKLVKYTISGAPIFSLFLRTSFATVVMDLGGAHPTTWFNPGLDKCYFPPNTLFKVVSERTVGEEHLVEYGLQGTARSLRKPHHGPTNRSHPISHYHRGRSASKGDDGQLCPLWDRRNIQFYWYYI